MPSFSKFLLSILIASLAIKVTATTTLYNGAQGLTLSSGLSNRCNAAFNTSLTCPQSIQHLTYANQDVGWNATSLTNLCTAACNSSISTLRKAVVSGCGSESLLLSGLNLTYPQVIDLYQYKYDMVCLKDPSSGKFCELIENSWNITQMVQSGTVTWPTNTQKTYYAPYLQLNWYPYTDENGTEVPPPLDNTFYNASQVSIHGPPSAFDYFRNTPPPTDDTNYGWPQILASDELPLQIQCSSCYLNRYIHAYSSYWGDVWEEMSSQVWANMQSNCKIKTEIIPAHNLTGWNTTGQLTPSITRNLTACAQVLTVKTLMNCQSLSLLYKVPTATISDLNNFSCAGVIGSVCAPQSCAIARVPVAQGAAEFATQYNNFTLTQFMTWNPAANAAVLYTDDIVCVGPPGGFYHPPAATPANPTIFTTTAKPPSPTVSGTIPNCGLYYNVSAGNYCNTLTLNFTITLQQLLDMNCGLDTNCDNLEAGVSYCVGIVNGTSVTSCPPRPSTTVAPPASTPVSPPGPTQTGTTNNCREWYVVQSGDYCSKIENLYSISDAQFHAWNTGINSGCGNLVIGDAYCVAGPPLSTAAKAAVATEPTKDASRGHISSKSVHSPAKTSTK